MESKYSNSDLGEILEIIKILPNDLKQARKAIVVEAAIRYGNGRKDRVFEIYTKYKNNWEKCWKFCKKLNSLECLCKEWTRMEIPSGAYGYRLSSEILECMAPEIAIGDIEIFSSHSNIVIKDINGYSVYVVPVIYGGLLITWDNKVIDEPHYLDSLKKIHGEMVLNCSEYKSGINYINSLFNGVSDPAQQVDAPEPPSAAR
jgi:hypothetical protein